MADYPSDAFFDEWGAPAQLGAHHGINRYLVSIWEGREDLQAAFPDLDGDDGAELVRWAYTAGRFEHPMPDALLPPCPEDLASELVLAAGVEHALEATDPLARTAAGGINVLGYLRGELGLGEAARLTIGGLDAVGVPVLPVDAGVRDAERDGATFAAVPPEGGVLGTTLACANPEVLGGLRRDSRRVVRELVHTNATVAFVWWEIEEQIPFEWKVEDLSWLSEIWVGSEHVRRCLEPFVTVPVITVGLPIDPDPVVLDARAELGLPEGFCFLSAFDYSSDLRRKNPLGVIQAFSAAFAPGAGVSLVLKCTSSAGYAESHALVASAASAHPDIHVVDQLLPDAEYNALLACCDCYVSLHRAEGFGLPLANAMHHGRPVIATAYSGNLDFMTQDNSYLIPARRVRVAESERYPVDGIWGEPDILAAIDAMRAVVADPASAAAKGRQAALDIRRTHAPEVVGARMAQRLEQILSPAPVRPVAGMAQALIAAGPLSAAASSGRARRLARSAMLRAIKPYTDHRERLDRALVAALHEVHARATGELAARLRAGALAHAATLAQQRHERRATALRDAAEGLSHPARHGPPGDSAPHHPDPATQPPRSR
jgi:glycosyltransferase involved in cell wall biosynthesis